MEKGATVRTNGFNISDNKLLLSSNSDEVVRLMKQKLHHHPHHHSSDEEVFPSKIWMDIHRDRPVDGGGANEAAVVGRDDAASSSSCSTYARSCTNNSQPFDILAPSYSTSTTTPPYKSLGGGGMAAAFPFTCAQWKELERQAMIYKYMISSVPVPPNLLFPLSTTAYSPSSLVSNAGGYSKNGDLEPGRCKRTDGKKWRCSREVAPGHKYCERHLHRGRPRSRKPVELAKNDVVLLPNKKTRLQHLPISTPTTSLHLAASATTTTTTLPKSDPTISSYKGFNRDMGFGFANANEGSSIYGSTPIFHQDYYMDQLQLNMLPYNPTMEIGSQATGFIDAWSTDNLNTNNQNNNGSNEYSLSWMNRGDFSPSLDLSIAMAAGNFIDSEMANVRMGAADQEENTIKDSNSSMPSPVFWEPFGRGGPLAEALQVTSPRECSIGTPATTVSSPSGVVYNNNNSNSRTLFSQSDGSVCNSPTFAVPTSEVAFHRFS